MFVRRCKRRISQKFSVDNVEWRMDSILISRQSLDDGDNLDLDDGDVTIDDDSSIRPTSRRSLNRYDTDQDLQSTSSFEQEGCNDEWGMEELVCKLRANSPDFIRLELDDQLEEITGLLDAMTINTSVKIVEVHIEALEGLSKVEQVSLAGAICRLPSLQQLLVYKNSSVFLQPLALHRPGLNHLRLCKLDVTNTKNAGILNDALKGIPSLRSLDIGFEANDADEVLEALNQLKSHCMTLESFRMDYKLLQQEATEEDYTLDDRIVVAIAQAVEQSITLKCLSLPPFGCTDGCHQVLIALLQQNCVLEQIDYWVRICSLYYPDANETIDHLLHLNRSGVRKLLKQQEGITASDLQEQVLSHHLDTDIMYYLFSSDPSLLLGNA